MTPQQIEAMKLALEALTYIYTETTADEDELIDQAITAIKEALGEHAMRETQRLGQEIEQEPVAKYCCRLCFNKSGSLLLDRMILCSECGNKRCPKATNHELQCTNSNAPNQAGSIYNTPPQPEQEPVAWKWRVKDFCDWPKWSVSLKRPADSGHAQYPRTEGYEDIPLYPHPPQRKPLTDEEIFACENSIPDEVVSDRNWCIYFARAIEAAHGIKENT